MNLKLIPALFCLFMCCTVKAQLPVNAFSFSCTKDTTIACGQNCITLNAKVPAINKFSDQYTVNKADCFRTNVVPQLPGTSANFNQDDRYSPMIPLPFIFPFYGIYYDNLVLNTNGIISFDMQNANTSAQWIIQGLDGSLPSTDYDRAIIMGAFHDIDIAQPSSPNRKIKYDLTGTAPHRKWVLTFYKVPCFECNEKINNTYQITLYEGLGLVEIHVSEREVCATWNGGAAMIGMQSYEQDKGIMAPGRSAFTSPRWNGVPMNEAWRFAPKEGASLLKRVELYKSTGEFVALGDTVNDGNGNYNVSFNNVCQQLPADSYIIKSSYYNSEYPFQFSARDSIIYATDTINVLRSDQFTFVNYPRNIYCNTENLQETPLVNGINGGIFSADVPGLSIDSISGVINIAASDTGLYRVRYHITTNDSCVIPMASTMVRIVDSTQFVWTGAIDNTWENPANWSCNNLPTSTSDVVIYSGNVVVNSNITINRLTVKPGAGVVVNSGYNLTILNPGN